MTAYTMIYLRCDWPDCCRTQDTHRRLLRDARADAAKDHGWASGAGLDLCGPPSKTWHAQGKAADHATAGHIPQAKQAKSTGRAWVQVGCSCGWVAPEKTIREGVRYRWTEHIRTDVLSAPVPPESEASRG